VFVLLIMIGAVFPHYGPRAGVSRTGNGGRLEARAFGGGDCHCFHQATEEDGNVGDITRLEGWVILGRTVRLINSS
jgi:hypothetical protein